MAGRAVRLLLILAAAYVALCALVFLGQRRLLYFPGPAPVGSPAGLGRPWSTVTLETADGERLGAWWIEAEEPRGAVLVSHGNAGSIEDRLSHARAFLALGLSVLLYDYRGYGESTGTPTERGLYADGRAAWEWLRAAGWEPRRILLYGESLGAAVAAELARTRPAAGLLLDSAFTSVPDVGVALYPWLPVRWLTRDRLDTRAKLGSWDGPLLVAHGRRDRLVPPAHAEELAAVGDTQVLWLPGGHNDLGLFREPGALEALAAFVDVAFDRGR